MAVQKKIGLIVFGKYPTPGKVKTRLAAETSPLFSSQLYHRFLEDVFDHVTQIDADILPFISPESCIPDFQKAFCPNLDCFQQSGSDLGDRLTHAFQTGFNQGYQHLMVMGSDSPDLPTPYLIDGFTKLENGYHHVFGPSTDGGYYLYGTTQSAFTPSVFQSIAWSTSKVLEQSLNPLKKDQASIHLLPKWTDIDTLDDLKDLMARSTDSTFRSSRTMAYLNHSDFDLQPPSN